MHLNHIITYYIYIYIYKLFKEKSRIFRIFYLVITQLVYTFLHFLFVTFLWFVRFEISLILKKMSPWIFCIYLTFIKKVLKVSIYIEGFLWETGNRPRSHPPPHLGMSRWAKKCLPNKQMACLDCFYFLQA